MEVIGADETFVATSNGFPSLADHMRIPVPAAVTMVFETLQHRDYGCISRIRPTTHSLYIA